MIAVGFLLALSLGSFASYFIHWTMHQPWSGPFYRSHMQHHLVHYPVGHFFSLDRYRSSGWSSGWLTFTPVMLAVGAGVYILLGTLHIDAGFRCALIGFLGIVGWMHGYVHDAFHVRLHWLGRFRWFRRLRVLHGPHHVDMNKNLGILWFTWDRIFRTFQR